MRTSHHDRVAAAASIASLLACACTAQAQLSPIPAETPVVGAAASAATDALRREAAALYEHPEMWDRVIQLRAYAAHLAAADDPLRVEDLWMAGNVSAALGRLGDAELYLEEAASAALARGDVPRAGQGYVAACIVAVHRGSLDSARALLDSAELMVHSAGMRREVRDILQPQIAQLTERLAALKARITD